MKKVTVKDIARRSGYSVATVSKTLNGTDRVGEETVRKIKKIAMEMGYRSSFSAQSLARKGRRIALVLFQSPPEVRRLFEDGFAKSFDLYMEFGIEPVYWLFDHMSELDWQAIGDSSDAVIITPGQGFEACVDQMDALGRRMPMVILQTRPPVFSTACMSEVTVDAEVVGALAAQILGLCAPGCRAAVITGYPQGWIHSENIRGFLTALAECGMENLAVSECRDSMELAYDCTRDLLKRYPDLGGLFVTSYVSPAVCRGVRDAGRSLPVVGVDLFSDSVACLRDGSLTAAIFQNQQRQAQMAVEVAVNSFRGIAPEPRLLVKPEIVLKSNLSCYGWS